MPDKNRWYQRWTCRKQAYNEIRGGTGMRTKSVLAVTMVLGGLCAATSSANAAAYTFTTIDFPGSSGTIAKGINDAGQIVGSFNGDAHGFLASGGSFTQI